MNHMRCALPLPNSGSDRLQQSCDSKKRKRKKRNGQIWRTDGWMLSVIPELLFVTQESAIQFNVCIPGP